MTEDTSRSEKFKQFVNETADAIDGLDEVVGLGKSTELAVTFTLVTMLANGLHDVADAIRSKA